MTANGKVKFSVMSVILFTWGRWVPIVHGLSLSPPPPTCSNLFNLVLTVQGLPQNIFKLDQYKAGKVGKLAVGILLECFLIIEKSISPNQCTFFNKRPFKKLIKVLLTLILALQMNKTVTFKWRIYSTNFLFINRGFKANLRAKWNRYSLCLPIKFWHKSPLQNQDWNFFLT